MSATRRTLLLAPLLAPAVARARPATVTDLLGREADVPAAPRRLLLGDGFQLLTLSLLHPDPVSLLAGWAGNLRGLDTALHDSFRHRFPALDAVPVVDASAEAALAMQPDLAVFSAWQVGAAATQATVQALQAAGVPVVFVDLFLHPLRNTAPSLRLLGRLLGREDQAEAFIAFRERHLEAIRDGMAGAPPGPTLLLHAHAGRWPCCWSAGTGGVGETLDLLGARNIGTSVFPGSAGGALNLEYVVSADPEVYVATGQPMAGSAGGISVGPGVAAEQVTADLARVTQMPGLAELKAVRNGRAHAMWNYFSDSPAGIVATVALARWIRPERFQGLKPSEVMADINARFAAMPLAGAFFTD